MKPRMIIHAGRKYDVVYSPDDYGYYLQRWLDDAVSEHVYTSQEQAIFALQTDTVGWSDIQ